MKIDSFCHDECSMHRGIGDSVDIGHTGEQCINACAKMMRAIYSYYKHCMKLFGSKYKTKYCPARYLDSIRRTPKSPLE